MVRYFKFYYYKEMKTYDVTIELLPPHILGDGVHPWFESKDFRVEIYEAELLVFNSVQVGDPDLPRFPEFVGEGQGPG